MKGEHDYDHDYDYDGTAYEGRRGNVRWLPCSHLP